VIGDPSLQDHPLRMHMATPDDDEHFQISSAHADLQAAADLHDY
jgi:hypothetical protein